jgi:hypothetical protein
MGDAEDFWPPIDNAEDPDSPVVVLRKQAQILTEKSGQRLQGRVSTETVRLDADARELLGIDASTTAFTHVFRILVPSLEYYSYALFAISHGIAPYPVAHKNDANVWEAFANVNAFKTWLRAELSSEKTKRIVKTLSEQAER